MLCRPGLRYCCSDETGGDIEGKQGVSGIEVLL
jgi:hypothetical protein